MRLSSVVLAATLVLAVPGVAPGQQVLDREEALVQAERVLAEVLGGLPEGVEPVFEDHGDGLLGVSVPLPARLQTRAGKPLNTLAIGNSNITPSSPSSLISVPFASCYSNYNFWFVVLNQSGQDLTASSKRQLNGPGSRFNKSSNITYAANTVKVLWDTHDEKLVGGLYTYIVKVSGAAAAKSRLVAVNGC